jgi:AraC-like DNA-binding protein
MSALHFARDYRATLGASPPQQIIRTRIETAQGLLKTPALSVADVAHRVCHDELSRFGKHVKRQVGATSRAYRAGSDAAGPPTEQLRHDGFTSVRFERRIQHSPIPIHADPIRF